MKNSILLLQLKLIALFLTSFWSWNGAFAVDRSSLYQVHTRTGMFTGAYNVPESEPANFSNPVFDIEFEVFADTVTSFSTRAIMVMGLSDSRVNYTYAGIGMTHYLFSKGKKEFKEEKSSSYRAIPKYRYYWGWNTGIAQVLVIPFGLVLGTYSTTLDGSVNGGMIYQVTENLGIEGRIGVGLGYGFSTVTATGTTLRAFAGVTYYINAGDY